MIHSSHCTIFKICTQDADGETALHIAVLRDKVESIPILLEGGAIPTTRNEKGFTPMHDAAKRGFVS